MEEEGKTTRTPVTWEASLQGQQSNLKKEHREVSKMMGPRGAEPGAVPDWNEFPQGSGDGR